MILKSYNTTEEELRKHFEKYGAIKMVSQ